MFKRMTTLLWKTSFKWFVLLLKLLRNKTNIVAGTEDGLEIQAAMQSVTQFLFHRQRLTFQQAYRSLISYHRSGHTAGLSTMTETILSSSSRSRYSL
jgi:hypothetical protein